MFNAFVSIFQDGLAREPRPPMMLPQPVPLMDLLYVITEVPSPTRTECAGVCVHLTGRETGTAPNQPDTTAVSSQEQISVSICRTYLALLID